MSTSLAGNILRKRGDTKRFKFTFRDRNNVNPINNKAQLLDLSGYTAVMTGNTDPEPTNIDDQVFSIAGTITSPTSGVIEFIPLPTDVDILEEVYFDIQLTKTSNSETNTILDGVILFSQDISK